MTFKDLKMISRTKAAVTKVPKEIKKVVTEGSTKEQRVQARRLEVEKRIGRKLEPEEVLWDVWGRDEYAGQREPWLNERQRDLRAMFPQQEREET